jgi:hypothetical protein
MLGFGMRTVLISFQRGLPLFLTEHILCWVILGLGKLATTERFIWLAPLGFSGYHRHLRTILSASVICLL